MAAYVELSAERLKDLKIKEGTLGVDAGGSAGSSTVPPAQGGAPTPPKDQASAGKSISESRPDTKPAEPQDILSGETDPETRNAILALGRESVLQQIDYAMKALSASIDDGDNGTLPQIVAAARRTFGETPEALTLLVDTRCAAVLDEKEKKSLTRRLAGGALVVVPWDLDGKALVMRWKPPGVTWYTAIHLQEGWSPSSANVARISVVSRLLLDASGVWPRYRASISDEAEVPAPGPQQRPRGAGQVAKKAAVVKKATV